MQNPTLLKLVIVKFQNLEAKEIIFFSIMQLMCFVSQMWNSKYRSEGVRKWKLLYTIGVKNLPEIK